MQVSQSDFITVHHEMGHIQYYLSYQNLPLEFRTAAHPGFHEAVGDAISLSVMTPKHLYSLDLLKENIDDHGRSRFCFVQFRGKLSFDFNHSYFLSFL